MCESVHLLDVLCSSNLKASKPELRRRLHRGGAAEIRIDCEIETEVILILFSSTRSPIKVATYVLVKPAVKMKGVRRTVSGQYCTVGTNISPDIDKLGQKAKTGVTTSWFCQ